MYLLKGALRRAQSNQPEYKPLCKTSSKQIQTTTALTVEDFSKMHGLGWHQRHLINQRRTVDFMQAHRTWSFELALILLAYQQSAFAEEFSGIAVPENSVIVLAVAAEGVQIYESKPNPAGFQWSLKVPQAELKSMS
jgi:hypothetical protein